MANPETSHAPEPGVESTSALPAPTPRKATKVVPRSTRKGPLSRRSVIGAALLVVGVVLLLATLFVGWYAYSITAADSSSGTPFTITGTITLFPLDQVSEAVSCQGWSGCSSYNGTVTGPYPQGGSNSLGGLYDLVAGLVIASIALGLAAAVLTLARVRRLSRLTGILVVLAIVLLALAPTILLAAQPSVLSAQGAPFTESGKTTSTSSPGTSFFGSCSGTGCGVSLQAGVTDSGTWGPSLGWYLCLGALAPLLAGLLVIRGEQKRSFLASLYEPSA